MTTYAEIMLRSTVDEAYRDGLLAAAEVARAQGPTCPAVMVAVYVEKLAEGEKP